MKYKMTHRDTERLLYLERICKVYVKFLDLWGSCDVWEKDGKVTVKWYNKVNIITSKGREMYADNYTTREFPVSYLPKRIASYKQKLRREFKKRHDAK